MESSLDVKRLDMNDAVNLRFYTQIIRFQLSLKEEEVVFQAPDLLQQRAIERWAKSLGLVYEYDSVSGRVKVGKGVVLEIRDSSTQTDHLEALNGEHKAGGEDGTLGDDSRGETMPLFLSGEKGGEKMTTQLSDGATEIQDLQTDTKISQDPSFMSSIGPSAAIASPHITAPAKTETTGDPYSTIDLPVSSIVNPAILLPAQNTPNPTSPIPRPIPTLNFTDGSHFPGSLLWAPTEPIFPQPTKEPEEALRLAEEKRARSAAASARFRYNRKVKKETTARFEALEQNITDLESKLREMEAEKEFYRYERDRFRDVVLKIPRLRYLAIPSAKL